MNIKKVDDKPMVIHTKEKPKLKVKGAPETKIRAGMSLLEFSLEVFLEI